MENANKALIMAASTLLALMLFAVFTYFIKSISVFPQTENELLSTKQKAAFNQEYELYEKSAMYGVDVISCLNKARSNNEKYAEGGGFLSGDAYGSKYFIDVIFSINSILEETIEVTGMNALGEETTLYNEADVISPLRDNSSQIEIKDIFSIDDKLTVFGTGTNKFLKYSMADHSKSLETGKAYSLVNDSEVLQLLNHSNNLKQIVKNKEENILLSTKGWCTATWTTYLYNFKKKRFTCTNLEYSPKTGLVNKIEFKEIN